MTKEERDQEIREQALKSALNTVYGEDMRWFDYLFYVVFFSGLIVFCIGALSQ